MDCFFPQCAYKRPEVCNNVSAGLHFIIYTKDSDHISNYCLFGMFHSSTCLQYKDVTLKSLQVPDGVVRVVFATIALGMGINLQDINLQDINTVIHYGVPRVLKSTSKRVAEQAGLVKLLFPQYSGKMWTVQ